MCSHPVVQLHEVAVLFAMAHCVRNMATGKLCRCDEYGPFERLLFLLYLVVCCNENYYF